MELQWPLILFTTLCAWSCGVFGTQGILALDGRAKKSQMSALITSIVLLAASGIAVFFHLRHWERIFNGFGHITSGITQELIAIIVFVVIAVVYFVFLRKSEDGSVPKWLAVCAIVIAFVLVAVCAHSYMMAARPAWDTVLEVASIMGAACLLGPATLAVIMAVCGDELRPAGLPAVVGAAICLVCNAAYGIYLQMCGGGFSSVGYYYDPTHPTKAMVDAAVTAGDQTSLIWLGAVVVGAVVPLVCALVARKKGDANSWKVFGMVAVVTAVVGAICLRVAFYNLGLSSFLYY